MTDANSSLDVSAVSSWANGLGLTHPVLVDDGSVIRYVTSGFPTYVVIDREMRIVNEDMWPWNDSTVNGLY